MLSIATIRWLWKIAPPHGDDTTSSSLDKVDDDDSSDANDDATPCTLDGDDDGSCPDDIATTSSPTSSHCFMSQDDTKVSNANVIDLIHMRNFQIDMVA